MHALVVDDSKVMRMVLEKELRALDFEVTGAENGQDALDYLNGGGQVDLMLVDWNMPVMNGYEFLCAVRANVLLNDVRIMMVTTETSITNVEQALAAGANEYLMKPFARPVLQDKLRLLGIG